MTKTTQKMSDNNQRKDYPRSMASGMQQEVSPRVVARPFNQAQDLRIATSSAVEEQVPRAVASSRRTDKKPPFPGNRVEHVRTGNTHNTRKHQGLALSPGVYQVHHDQVQHHPDEEAATKKKFQGDSALTLAPTLEPSRSREFRRPGLQEESDDEDLYLDDDSDMNPGAIRVARDTGETPAATTNVRFGSEVNLDDLLLETTGPQHRTSSGNEILITAEIAPDIDEEVARRLEEQNLNMEQEIHRRLEERNRNVDEEVQQRLQQLETTAVVVDTVMTPRERRKSQMRKIAITVFITALVSFLLLFFLMRNRGGDDEPTIPLPATAAPTNRTLAPTLSDGEYLRQVIYPLSGKNDSIWNDESSAQFQALQWLEQNDTLQLHQNRTVPTSQIVDRYVMTLLYFHNGGPYWTQSMNFLNDTASVCEWNTEMVTGDGVQCDQFGNVEQLVMHIGT